MLIVNTNSSCSESDWGSSLSILTKNKIDSILTRVQGFKIKITLCPLGLPSMLIKVDQGSQLTEGNGERKGEI